MRGCRRIAPRRSQRLATATPTTRFVILVPAHNEALNVAATVQSIVANDYPEHLRAVHVVADNCVDETAEVARRAGADAHERHDENAPGKGPALNWLVQRLVNSGEPFDVAVFVDADSIVDDGFLAAMDARFQAGATVVQGLYGVRDAFESPAVAIRWCALIRPSISSQN